MPYPPLPFSWYNLFRDESIAKLFGQTLGILRAWKKLKMNIKHNLVFLESFFLSWKLCPLIFCFSECRKWKLGEMNSCHVKMHARSKPSQGHICWTPFRLPKNFPDKRYYLPRKVCEFVPPKNCIAALSWCQNFTFQNYINIQFSNTYLKTSPKSTRHFLKN